MNTYDSNLIEKLYSSLYLIRRTEEEIARIYPTDKIKSPVHLSIGQEAVAVGVCQALETRDVVFGTYRGHAMYLAKGGSLKSMIAELYGKSTGCAKGKGGSMHLINTDAGIMGTSAIVGTNIPMSVGYAYGLMCRGSDAIAVSFFGDGAVDEGVFHESMNFAALKQVPALFVCENNFYAVHSHHLNRHKTDNICQRAKSYGMHFERIDDGDVFKIYDCVKANTEKMRNGNSGPVFLECMTCRWKGHVGPNEDFHLRYRNEEEVRQWMSRDQVKRLAVLLDSGKREEIEKKTEERICEAFKFAEESPFPGPEQLHEDLYK